MGIVGDIWGIRLFRSDKINEDEIVLECGE
jgi:hypothetical protein